MVRRKKFEFCSRYGWPVSVFIHFNQYLRNYLERQKVLFSFLGSHFQAFRSMHDWLIVEYHSMKDQHCSTHRSWNIRGCPRKVRPFKCTSQCSTSLTQTPKSLFFQVVALKYFINIHRSQGLFQVNYSVP